MKLTKLLFFVTVLTVLLTACAAVDAEGGNATTTTSVTVSGETTTATAPVSTTAAAFSLTTTMDPAFTTTRWTTTTTVKEGAGMCHPDSDYPEYSRTYDTWFSVEMSLGLLAEEDEYEAWEDTFEFAGGTRDNSEFNVYNLIVELNIPRSAVEQLCAEYEQRFGGTYLPDEAVNILYTGTAEEVHAYFAMPHSLVMGTKVFSPRWLVEHTVEDYRAAGITAEIFEQNFEKVSGGCYKEEQRQILREKLEEIKG